MNTKSFLLPSSMVLSVLLAGSAMATAVTCPQTSPVICPDGATAYTIMEDINQGESVTYCGYTVVSVQGGSRHPADNLVLQAVQVNGFVYQFNCLYSSQVGLGFYTPKLTVIGDNWINYPQPTEMCGQLDTGAIQPTQCLAVVSS